MFESKSKYKVNDHPYLVSTCYFKGRDYLVKMNVSNKKALEIKVTDKHTMEDWFCSYDASYIENLTRKTGNYKQFSIFVAMLKSGLMKTSESVSLDLLTFNDLEILTTKRIMSHTIPNHPDNTSPTTASNRRYLILIYTVEFDRVHYPLPMEYCGPPDSQMLLATIRRLEQEVNQLHGQLEKSTGHEELTIQISNLEKRVVEANQENDKLRKEVSRLNDQLAAKNKVPPKFVEAFQNSILKLEEQVKQQRLAMKQHLDQFQSDRAKLNAQVEEYKNIEKNLLQELESLQKRQRPPEKEKETRQSRFESFNKRTQRNSVDNQPCISTQRKATLFDGCPRRINEPRNVSSRRSRRRSSSSDSSLGRRSKRGTSPKRLLKDKSSSIESMHEKEKDSGNDIKITELEKRVNALQKLLEKDFSLS
ncbi:centrosomal protein CCDC61 isoform X2 [Nilaparvata lugens]|uniref:centrosomal protein CCDC61 isoform X2 n=1 Tax=Nilaparvata lugens TaxID=108931 RepID=UPI00193D9DB6|nr:centrosomal protein CCDC61 isoform X2 [Nilaparvata lugens]